MRSAVGTILVGELITRGGQRAARAIQVVERGLIKLALAQGHDIVNVQGTRIRSHHIRMAGNREARSWLPSTTVQFE
jgi:hypothetical protein